MDTDDRDFIHRRHVIAALATLGAGALAACAAVPREDPAVVAAIAPQGRLRACINLGNPILARRAADGEVQGVSVDLARELARQLGVAAELVVVDAALRSVQAVAGGAADVGFFAVDPQRAQGVRFTAPYVLIEGAYLVRDASPLRASDEVDRPGTRVVVGRGSAYDLFLSRELKAAQLLRVATSQEVVQAFLAQGAEVAAGVRQQLEADAARGGGLRLLPGRFMRIDQAMGLALERGDAAHERLGAFVRWAKAGGFVAAALERHRIAGAAVAPLD